MDAEQRKAYVQMIARNDQEMEAGKSWMHRAGYLGINRLNAQLHHQMGSPDGGQQAIARFALIGMRAVAVAEMERQEQEGSDQ